MTRSRAFRAVVTLGLLLASACSSDVTVLSGCPEGMKSCIVEGAATCVAQDPAHGCKSANCTSCIGQMPNVAESTCNSDGQCTKLTCQPNFLDCDSNDASGCEIDARVGTPAAVG